MDIYVNDINTLKLDAVLRVLTTQHLNFQNIFLFMYLTLAVKFVIYYKSIIQLIFECSQRLEPIDGIQNRQQISGRIDGRLNKLGVFFVIVQNRVAQHCANHAAVRDALRHVDRDIAEHVLRLIEVDQVEEWELRWFRFVQIVRHHIQFEVGSSGLAFQFLRRQNGGSGNGVGMDFEWVLQMP